MLSINSNISSLTAQENLNSSGNALSQAITRLSSGKRINSAADDAAGLAISTTLQTAINGLNQGVSNANDGVSMVQTASTGLSQITQSLQPSVRWRTKPRAVRCPQATRQHCNRKLLSKSLK